MRRSLLKLNERHLPKALRQALVLITMLLLPSAAWGLDNTNLTFISNFTGFSNNAITFDGGSTGQWEIYDYGDAQLGSDGTNAGLKISTANGQSGSITFKLKSKFVVSQELTGISNDNQALLATMNLSSDLQALQECQVQMCKAGDTYNTSLDGIIVTNGSNDKTFKTTANLTLSNDYIVFEFQVNNGSYLTIQSINLYNLTTPYYLTVADQEVTSANASDIFGDGKVSFTPDNGTNGNILTLNDATINGSVILQSGLENLTIHLVGENKIQGENRENKLENGIKREDGTTSGALTFTTDDNTPGNLFFPNVTTPIDGFTNIAYNNGLAWGCDSYIEKEKTCTNFYQGVGTNVVIAAVAWNACITKENTTITTTPQGTIAYRNSDGKNILTLTSITDYNTSIDWYSPEDVTIEIDGDNSFVFDTDFPKIVGNSQSNISFTKKTTSATLRFWHKGTGVNSINLEVPYISGFKNAGDPNLGEGLYHVDLVDTRKDNDINTDFTEHYITTEAYDLTVKGIRVHNIEGVFIGHKDHILGEKTDGDFDETLKFTPPNNSNQTPATLTMNGANIEYAIGNVIVSTLTTPLEVIISGNSYIYSGSHFPFEGATGDNANLVFSGVDQASLVMTSSHDGFSPTSFYTGFNEVSYPEDDGNQLYAHLSENNVVIEQVMPYNLTVAGVAVTSANANNITGDNITEGKVSFTPAKEAESIPATLTLDGATISGGIYTTLKDLTIDIKNTNSISTSTGKNGILSSDNSGTLTFTGSGSLEISSRSSVIRGFKFIEGLNLETKTPYEIYEDGYYRLKDKVAADTTGVKWLKVIQDTTYPLWIAGTQVTASNYENVLGNETKTVAFDGVDKLTLSEAIIDCQAGDNHYPVVSTIKDLKVHLVKINTFNILHNYEAFKYAGGENSATLTFSTVDPSDYQNLGSFKIVFENNYVHNPVESNISSGYSIKVSEGETSSEISGDFNWNWDSNQDTSVSGWMGHKYNAAGAYIKLFYLQVYNLWLSTTRFYYPNGLSPASGITFDPDLSTPTLTYNYGDDSYHVYSGLSELTLKIGCNNESNQANYRMRAVSFGKPEGITATIAEKGNLILAKDDSEGEFRFLGDGTNPVISGFTSVTYDDFTILSDGAKYDTEKKQLVDASGNPMTAATFATSVELEKPSITSESQENGNGVIVYLSENNDYDVSIKYSINYADGSEGVTDATYNSDEAPTLSKPATVTAYVYLNGETSEPATGKYFGLKEDSYTIAIDGTLTPTFDPEIGSTDEIAYSLATESNNISITEGVITGVSEGEATVSVTFNYTVNQDPAQERKVYILNSSDESMTFSVNIGAALSSIFEGENTYGAVYSETAIQVPEGMTAYVITGIDEENGTVKTSDPLDFIPANTAVLLENVEGKAIAMTHVPYTGTATAPENNKLKYSDPASPAKPSTTDNWYVLYNNKFVKVTTNTEVKGGKCYLNLNGTTAGTRGFYNIGDGEGTTGIREVKSREVKGEKLADDEWFDLQGRRLNAKPNKSGLYILNGKKIVIK